MCHWDPRKLHVSVYKNAQTIISWLLLAFKGVYNTHIQPVSVSYIPVKRCMRYVHIRKQWLAYVSYTETVKRVHVLHKVKSVLLLWHHLDFTQTKKEINYSRARKQSNFFSSVINGLQEYTSCPMLNSSKLNKNYWAKTVDYLKYSE